ncbi:MAG: sigma-70 family RNA polymerase sigma factor [Alphaproteobacteria bacterium]
MTNHSDLVIAVAKHRDREAFRELFDYFAPRLRSFIQRRGADGAEAEEIVQETMVRVWRKAEKFNPDKAAASTWIFTIGRNAHIDLVRRTGRPEIDTDDPTFLPEPETDAVTRIAQGQDAGRIRNAMSGLPKEQRDILMLAYFEDKPHGRIAEQLDIPLGTVKSRIRLAFKRLRADLGEDE